MEDTNLSGEIGSLDTLSLKRSWVPSLWMTVVCGFMLILSLILAAVIIPARLRMNVVNRVIDRKGSVAFDIGGVTTYYHGTGKSQVLPWQQDVRLVT